MQRSTHRGLLSLAVAVIASMSMSMASAAPASEVPTYHTAPSSVAVAGKAVIEKAVSAGELRKVVDADSKAASGAGVAPDFKIGKPSTAPQSFVLRALVPSVLDQYRMPVPSHALNAVSLSASMSGTCAERGAEGRSSSYSANT
jgi:hypothetical protein